MRSIVLLLSEGRCRSTLSINLALDTLRMNPLIRTIKYLEKLVELNLAFNKLDDVGTAELCSSLMTLRSLRNLNLSNNRLTSKSMEMLCGVMLPSLITLNLSFNLLGDASIPTIISFCRRQLASIEEINLSCCLLTSRAWSENEKSWEYLMQERPSLKSIDLTLNHIKIQRKRQYTANVVVW